MSKPTAPSGGLAQGGGVSLPFLIAAMESAPRMSFKAFFAELPRIGAGGEPVIKVVVTKECFMVDLPVTGPSKRFLKELVQEHISRGPLPFAVIVARRYSADRSSSSVRRHLAFEDHVRPLPPDVAKVLNNTDALSGLPMEEEPNVQYV